MTWYEIYDDCCINLSSFWKFEIVQAHDGLWKLYGWRVDEGELLVIRDRPEELETMLNDMMLTAEGTNDQNSNNTPKP